MEAMQGAQLFHGLKDHKCIVMAANTRMTLVTEGIFQAAKELDSVLIIELAKSESNLDGGYTGLTPSELAKRTKTIADKVGHDAWVLHADHISVKKGTPEEIEDTKKLVAEQIKAGFTSFAIDASHLFDLDGKTEKDQLQQNIDATTEIAKFIEEHYGSKDYGLEVEVGEVGKKDSTGMVVTTPEEASAFIKALNENDVYPQVLAIANGSTHGNIYDASGNTIEQVSINISQTKEIARTIQDTGVRIAQHGITGTPRDLIYKRFPHGDIIKGNVGTFWQNLVYDVFKVYQPELYQEIWDWTLENYKEKFPGKQDKEVFGKASKKAIKVYFDRIYSIDQETKDQINARAYAEALMFFRVFKSKDTAKMVRQ
ncbi:class II fructose-bisphosphate aldolase [archaeon]|nr:class II fructose-bisphosphate aldolase [archaeon]